MHESLWQSLILWISSQILYAEGFSNKPDSRKNGFPSIRKPRHDFLVPFGRSVLLECQATGQQPIEIVWRKNNRIIDDGGDFKIIKLDTDNETVVSLMYILKMSKSKSGFYTCCVSNVVGKAVENFTIYGFVDDIFTSTDVTFIEINNIINRTTSVHTQVNNKHIYLLSIILFILLFIGNIK